MSSVPAPARPANGRVQVVQVLTKQDLGGAQLTALEACVSNATDIEIELWVGTDDDSDGRFLAAAADLGVTVQVIPTLRRRIGPVNDLRTLVTLYRRLRQSRPDVVHTHSSKAGVLGRMAARSLRIPVVHSVHGWSFHAGLRPLSFRLAATLERAMARLTTAFVVVTVADLDNAIRQRVGRPEQFHVIRSGIHLAPLQDAPSRRAELLAEIGVPNDGGDARSAPPVRIIGNVGRLATAKDPTLLIEAFAAIPDRPDDLHLVMIGDGPLEAEVATAASAARAPRHVHLLAGRPDAAAWISGFDVFALTSRHEGLPRTVVEAMAVGVPVVAPLINGIPELVEPRLTGYGWTDRDPAVVAEHLMHALNDPDRPAIVAAARHRVESFDVAVMRTELERLWRQLAGAPATSTTVEPTETSAR